MQLYHFQEVLHNRIYKVVDEKEHAFSPSFRQVQKYKQEHRRRKLPNTGNRKFRMQAPELPLCSNEMHVPSFVLPIRNTASLETAFVYVYG